MRCKSLSYLGALLAAVAISASAQVNGSFTGQVRDPSGAIIPGATVTVTNADRGIHRIAVTNSDGIYLVQAVGEGTYTITITAKGFETYVAANTILRVGQNLRVDATMNVGSQTTNVTVEGSAAGQVETESSGISTTITSKQISQLELNGRSFVQLVELSPGVSNQTGQSEGVTGPGGSVMYSINGGRTESNNWEIDGGDILDSGSMANLNVFPNIDALDQVQVFTSSFDAQYGRTGSGAIEAVTKSGTNQFHGEVFEYLRNQIFNAKNFFNPPDQRIGAYKKHDFGFTLGGPIVKDKTFFFYSEEIRRESVPGFYNLAVPSNAERAGDFTSVCPTSGTAFVRNPSGGSNYPIYPDCPAYSSNGQGGFLGFPGNNIAPYIDQVNAGALLSYIPTANTTDAATGLPFFREAAGAPYTSHEELFRIDHSFSPKLHTYFRFIHDAPVITYETSTPWSNSNLPGIPGHELAPGISMVLNLQWTASNTLTNEAMIGYGADHLNITNTTNAANLPAGMTMTGLFSNGFGGKVPSFSIGGGSSYYGMVQDAGPTPFHNSNPTYTYRDTLTKLINSHNLKVGFYFTANQKNEDGELWTQGTLAFNANGSSWFTSDPSNGGNPSSTGNSFADFLTGRISNYTQSNQEPKYHFKFKIFEPFVQDDWHVRKNLTLNLGLRMSMFGLYTEKNNLSYNFDPTAFNAANMPTVDPDDGHLVFAPGQSINNLSGIVQCGNNRIPKGCMTGHIWNPAPRIGFAYDPFGDGKTAIRGAYGIFYDHTNGNDANAESLEGQPPLVLTPIQFLIQGYNHIGGGEYFPLVPQSIPTGRVKWPYVQQYHFDIQRQAFRNTLVTVAYVGSKGTHLTFQNDLNQIHDLPANENPFPVGVPIIADVGNGNSCDTGTLPDGTPITGDALFHLNIACFNVNPDQYRQNFPGWSTITGIGSSASSSYNSLQVTGRHTADNLELTLAYTYSHSIDDSSDRYDGNFVDSYNLSASRASSNNDQRHILNISYVYTLPKFNDHGQFVRQTIGGWQWSGITESQSGRPFSIVDGSIYDNAGVANGNGTGSYADRAPGVDRHHITGPKWQSGIYGPLLDNPGAYNAPRGLTFGDSGRNSLYTPWTTNFDMGIFKNFPVKERTSIQFRAEAFNIFNHTQVTGVFNSPGCYQGNGSFSYNAGASACVDGSAAQGILPSNFLHPSAVHDPRILQFAMKVLF